MTILFAYILDLIVGDPEKFYHPVRGIGYFIKKFEEVLIKFPQKKISGVILVVMVVGVTYLITFLIVKISYIPGDIIGFLASSILIFTCLSVKSLYQESMKVYYHLRDDEEDKARRSLSMIVGRDTLDLDREGIARGAVETIAEGIVDGILSPLFYAFIGGAPLAMAYKAVNTLDSMVGYKNDRYIDFGRASARLDDIANFIPARIAGIVIPFAVALCGKNWVGSFAVIRNDRGNHPSPNSGIPEAGIAGALGVRLGGVSYYGGKPAQKPFIGKEAGGVILEDIWRANSIMVTTSAMAVLFGIILSYLFK
ncbi:MAG: adenosylcobinamide-phosphate synthase CbiB [Nitrospinota bacterium]